ncbi:MAG: 2'-5' RNA ligase family protein [Flavobacterium sp.]|nr:MAG: 2'-5' RNA ligase family protein [Flavobacterium sp.]
MAYFLKMSPAQSWIGQLRLRFDPKALLVAPHVTLVFPTDKISEGVLRAEVAKSLLGFQGFRMDFDELRIVAEGDNELVSIFLLVGLGREAVVGLHTNLYSGVLCGELRKEIPYVPHVTLGTGMRRGVAESVVGTYCVGKRFLLFVFS